MDRLVPRVAGVQGVTQTASDIRYRRLATLSVVRTGVTICQRTTLLCLGQGPESAAVDDTRLPPVTSQRSKA
jgi:hypothetical protein